MQQSGGKDLLQKCLKQGFSLASISMATQLSIEELQTILDGGILQDTSKMQVLMVFLTQLYFETPEDAGYYRVLYQALTEFFQIDPKAIAKYMDISVKELKTFEKSQNRDEIERKLAHLFTTFIRNPQL